MSGKNNMPAYLGVQRPCQFVTQPGIAATKNHTAKAPITCGKESSRKIFDSPFCEKHFNQINTVKP